MKLRAIIEGRWDTDTGQTTSRGNKIWISKRAKKCRFCMQEIPGGDMWTQFTNSDDRNYGLPEIQEIRDESGMRDFNAGYAGYTYPMGQNAYWHPECLEKYFKILEAKPKKPKRKPGPRLGSHRLGTVPQVGSSRKSSPPKPVQTAKDETYAEYEARIRDQIKDRSPTSLRGGSWSGTVQRNRRLD